MSDEMLDRLLSCMGYRLEVVRRPVKVELTRSTRRSWHLHRRLATHLTPVSFEAWRATLLNNLERLRSGVRGEPHRRNLDRWEDLIRDRDLLGLRLVMTGLDDDAVAMREVSPMASLLPQQERAKVQAAAATRPAQSRRADPRP